MRALGGGRKGGEVGERVCGEEGEEVMRGADVEEGEEVVGRVDMEEGEEVVGGVDMEEGEEVVGRVDGEHRDGVDCKTTWLGSRAAGARERWGQPEQTEGRGKEGMEAK